MENPKTWTKVHWTIMDAIDDHEINQGIDICGLSLVSTIYNKLRDNGYLNDIESSKKS